MIRRFRQFAVLFFAACSADSPAPVHTGVAPRVALLVGVNRYQRPSNDRTWPDLQGCAADAERMRRVLVDRFGFAAGDILVLTDEQATHEGIVAAFRSALIERSGPGTQAVFYFAGHGSHAKDASGSGTERGYDETLLAHDSRARGVAQPFDITDDELHSLLQALNARGAQATVVTDACHSGDVTRGDDSAGVRAVGDAHTAVDPARLRAVLGNVAFLDDGQQGARPWIHVAACRSDQRAVEERFELGGGQTTTAGLLTWCLVEQLYRLEPGSSWEQLCAATDMRMALWRKRFLQEMQLTGVAECQVFAGGFAPPLPGFAARVTGQRRVLAVLAGRLHLLAPGARARISGVDRRPMGEARLTQVFEAQSLATWIGDEPELAQDTALRAELLEGEPADSLLTVFVPAGEAGDRLAATIASARVEVVRQPTTPAQYSVHFDHDRKPHLRYFDGSALPVPRSGAQLAPELQLLDDLDREARYRALLALADLPRTFTPSVSVVVPTTEQRRAAGQEQYHSPQRLGELRFRLQSGADSQDVVWFAVAPMRQAVPLYLTILSVSEDRSCHVIYPYEHDSKESSRFAPDQAPPPHETGAVLTIPTDWPTRRRLRDRYLFIATAEPTDLTPLCSETTRGTAMSLPRHVLASATSPQSGQHALGLAVIDLILEREP